MGLKTTSNTGYNSFPIQRRRRGMFVEIQKENIMRSSGPAWKDLI